MNLLEAIKAQDSKLTKSDQLVLKYVKDNGLNACSAPISEIASSCGVSHATVTRFVRKFGFDSLRSFKLALAQELSMSDVLSAPNTIAIEHHESISTTHSKLESAASIAIYKALPEQGISQLEAITKRLCKAKRVFCIGLNDHCTEAFAYAKRLKSLGLDCRAIVDSYEVVQLKPLLRKKDSLLIISSQGNEPELGFMLHSLQQEEKDSTKNKKSKHTKAKSTSLIEEYAAQEPASKATSKGSLKMKTSAKSNKLALASKDLVSEHVSSSSKDSKLSRSSASLDNSAKLNQDLGKDAVLKKKKKKHGKKNHKPKALLLTTNGDSPLCAICDSVLVYKQGQLELCGTAISLKLTVFYILELLYALLAKSLSLSKYNVAQEQERLLESFRSKFNPSLLPVKRDSEALAPTILKKGQAFTVNVHPPLDS